MCLHAEFLVQQQSHYLRRQLHLLPVQVAVMRRSEKWELYLYGDFTIMVDSDSVDVLPRGVPPPRFYTHFGNGSHHLFVVPVCAWHGYEHYLAVPVSSGQYSGTCLSTAPAVYLLRCPSLSL